MPKTEPARFPWLDAAWRALHRQFSGDRAPHALLLSGLPGLGKLQLAHRLAAWLLCERNADMDDACSACRACVQLGVGTHPDLHACTLEEGAQSIKVDHVRGLIDVLQLSSQYGGWKIAIVEPADRMNAHSFNALLKTLEEPAGQALLVLVSARPARLPATIRSRCQQVAIPVPAEDEARAWLEQQGAGHAELLLRLAGGAPLAALELAGTDFIGARGALLDTLLALAEGREDAAHAALAWKDLALGRSVYWLQSVVHDLVRLKNPGLDRGLVNTDLQQGLQSLAQQIDLPALFRYQDELLRIQAVAETPVNPQLQMEGLLAPWKDNLESAA